MNHSDYLNPASLTHPPHHPPDISCYQDNHNQQHTLTNVYHLYQHAVRYHPNTSTIGSYIIFSPSDSQSVLDKFSPSIPTSPHHQSTSPQLSTSYLLDKNNDDDNNKHQYILWNLNSRTVQLSHQSKAFQATRIAREVHNNYNKSEKRNVNNTIRGAQQYKTRRMFKRSAPFTSSPTANIKRNKSRKSFRDSLVRNSKVSSIIYPNHQHHSSQTVNKSTSSNNYLENLVKKENSIDIYCENSGDLLDNSTERIEKKDKDFIETRHHRFILNKEENVQLKMIMNMANNDHHHHHHHNHHHQEHSNYITDLLSDSSPLSLNQDSTKSRLVLQDVENMVRSPSSYFYSSHHYSPGGGNHHPIAHHPNSQSYNPLYGQHLNDGSGVSNTLLMQNLVNTYQKIYYHTGLAGSGAGTGVGEGDHSPLQATSATSMVLPSSSTSSPQASTTILPSITNASSPSPSSSIKQNYSSYSELESHFESPYHQEMNSNKTNLVNGDLDSSQNGIMLQSKMPLQDHNSQQAIFDSDNVSKFKL